MTDELLHARMMREDDNTSIDPVDMLKNIIYEIEQGIIEADSLVVLAAARYDDTGNLKRINRFYAQVTREQELAMLSMATFEAHTAMVNDD